MIENPRGTRDILPEESEYEEIQFSLSIEYDNGSITSIDGIIPDWFEDEE